MVGCVVVSLSRSVDIQMHFKVCCSPFPRSEDRQLFEDPKSKKKSLAYISVKENKKTLTIHGANLLWDRILAPYL
jgi:hypothetical protein